MVYKRYGDQPIEQPTGDELRQNWEEGCGLGKTKFPLDANGQPTDEVQDIGHPQYKYKTIYAKNVQAESIIAERFTYPSLVGLYPDIEGYTVHYPSNGVSTARLRADFSLDIRDPLADFDMLILNEWYLVDLEATSIPLAVLGVGGH